MELDPTTKGFQSSSLILLGGVAGIGKTSLVISLIRKIVNKN
ncbi:DnaB-like helicase C-terminal domain-containing protein [Flavobacterium sp. W20_MBD1_R3]